MFLLLIASTLNIAVASFDEGVNANPKNFELPCITDGSTFQLKEQRGKVVVLHFLLKTECPYCLKYTREYTLESQEDNEIVHVFIKPDSEAELRAWVDHLRLESDKKPPMILRDADAGLAKKYRIPDGYQFHGQMVHYPAMIVLDRNGQEQFRYVGKSNSDRFPLKKFQAKKDEWKKSSESR